MEYVRLFDINKNPLGSMKRDYFICIGLESKGDWLDTSHSAFLLVHVPTIAQAKQMHNKAVQAGIVE